jgi:hypothetical protein
MMLPSPGNEDLAGHYERLADRFDANWAYSEAFVSWMTSRFHSRHRGPGLNQPGAGAPIPVAISQRNASSPASPRTVRDSRPSSASIHAWAASIRSAKVKIPSPARSL